MVKSDEALGTLGGALATAFCFVGCRRRRGGRPGSGWRDSVRLLVGASLLCYTIVQVTITVPDFMSHPVHLSYGVGTGIALTTYPLMLLGILRLPAATLPLASRTRIALDGLMIMTAVITFSWYFLLGPQMLMAHSSLPHKIVEASYPMFDLALLACLLVQSARTREGAMRLVVRILSVGLLVVIATDNLWAYLALHHVYHPGTVLDVGWSAGYMPIGLAISAARQRAPDTVFLSPTERGIAAADNDVPRMPALWQSFLPYALLPAVALLLFCTQAAHGNPKLVSGIEIGGVFLIALILLRQVLAILENRDLNQRLEALATTDPLTGLANHRTFQKRLNEEADRALREGSPVAIVMTDLDNFKFFNDSYGHAVGDQVLREVADALRACGRAYDTISRFGGDEFALLLPGQPPGSAEALQRDLNKRLSGVSYCPPGHDTAIPLTLSVGVALFPGDGATRLEALEVADTRLRRAKTGADAERPAEQLCRHLTRSVAGFEMLNSLVTAVDAKDRYTRRHSEDVLALSLQIARELGLDDATCYHIQVAALLHDIGKIGVPDSILRKPGKLTPDEYEAVKQHALMGAGIISAVPGFEETLDAVRHHHERWDGDGYPFGLRGEDIPRLARIMAVADAFSAMTTDRPYRKGMDASAALRILQEGADTQWDPICVAAFTRSRIAGAELAATAL